MSDRTQNRWLCHPLGTVSRPDSYVTPSGDIERNGPTSEANWQQIFPDGMYDILTRVQRDSTSDLLN
jgi:hypothetical protein